MASTRLTNNIKSALLRRLIERAFKAQAQDMIDKHSAFAVRVYKDTFADKLKKMNGLPEGWLPTNDRIKVSFAGQVQSMRFDGALEGWSIDSTLKGAGAKTLEVKDMRFTDKANGGCCNVYDATHPLAEEFTAHKNEMADLISEIQAAERTARTAMDSVTTVGKLIEVWPEVEEFAKDFLDNGERKAVLPMVPRQKLNDILGLPPHERLEPTAA